MIEEASDTCSLVWPFDSNAVIVSTQIKAMLGSQKSAGKYIHSTFFDLLHPDDCKFIENYIQELRALPPMSPFIREIRLRNFCNEWTTLRLVGETYGDDRFGGTEGLVGYLRPIAKDVVSAPNAPMLSRRQEHHSNGIWRWTRSGDRCYVSSKAMGILGFAQESSASSSAWWLANIHSTDFELLRAQWDLTLAQRMKFFRVELRVKSADGAYKWILVRCSITYDDTNHIERLMGSVTDVTEIRRINELLKDRTEQLNAVFQLSPDGLVVFDKDVKIRYVNPAFESILTLNSVSALGWSDLDLIKYLAAYAEEPTKIGSFASLRELTEHLFEADESKIYISVNGIRKVIFIKLLDSLSEGVSHILYLRDVSHETIVEEMKSQFISTTSHELRTPMASILGFSELLASKRRITSEQADTCVETIHEQALRMTQILDDLLDLSRLESLGKSNFNLQDVELSGVVRSVIRDFAIPEGRTPPKTELLNAIAFIDESRTYQVLLNILSNAYKYSASGDIEVFMQIIDSSNQIELKIQDHGIGISENDQKKLFERFFRVDTSGNIPGTGLGLNIVREIMLKMKGEVHIESELGVGTTVHLLFPRYESLSDIEVGA